MKYRGPSHAHGFSLAKALASVPRDPYPDESVLDDDRSGSLVIHIRPRHSKRSPGSYWCTDRMVVVHPDRLEQRIGHFAANGWRLLAIDGDRAIMKRPNFGSRIGHVIVFLTTVWFTAGLGNLVYALHRYINASEYRIISAYDPIDEEEALAILRRRYARGELTDDEFERRVGRLLATDSIADVRRDLDLVVHSDE